MPTSKLEVKQFIEAKRTFIFYKYKDDKTLIMNTKYMN